MNDSARENPMPTSTAPAAVECPQCGTQLRLLRPATVHTPIACCICGATFYLQPVETAPVSDADIRPRRMVPNGPGMRPIFRVVSPPGRRLADRGPGDPPPSMSTPAPPPPGPGTRSAPGMPKPVELPEHLQRGFRTRWMESVLGAVLVLLIVVAVCAGGFVLVKALWSNRSTTPTPTAEEPTSEDAKSLSADGNPNADALPSSPGYGSKPLPRPEGLVGNWESRVDDGSNSSFVFGGDGKLIIAQAGDPPPPPIESGWYLAERRGDELVIEVGPAFGTLNNARLTLRLTSPNAFTLIRHVRQGVTQPGGDLRYIRTGIPVKAPAAGGPALAPMVGPPAPSS